MSLSFIEQLEHNRVQRNARALLRRIAKAGCAEGLDAQKILDDDVLFSEFVEAAIVDQHRLMGGPILEVLHALIQSFIDDPERWITLIIKIIGRFVL